MLGTYRKTSFIERVFFIWRILYWEVPLYVCVLVLVSCFFVGYIFSNLPGNWFNTIVRAFLSIELTLTFPIVIKPATDVMEEIWKNILMVSVHAHTSLLI